MIDLFTDPQTRTFLAWAFLVIGIALLLLVWGIVAGGTQEASPVRRDQTIGVDQLLAERRAQLQADQDPTERLNRLHREHALKAPFDAPSVGRFGKGSR